jgi:hypothetical protein
MTTDDLNHIEKTMLCFAADGGSRPLRGWRSCKYYEELIGKGYIEERPSESAMFRHFVLSAKGRAKIEEMSKVSPAGLD